MQPQTSEHSTNMGNLITYRVNSFCRNDSLVLPLDPWAYVCAHFQKHSRTKLWLKPISQSLPCPEHNPSWSFLDVFRLMKIHWSHIFSDEIGISDGTCFRTPAMRVVPIQVGWIGCKIPYNVLYPKSKPVIQLGDEKQFPCIHVL